MPETAFPDVPFPGLPREGDWCLARVDKRAVGTGEFTKLRNEYKCGDKDLTARGKVKCNLRLSRGRDGCTETDFVPNDSTLSAEGQVIRRADGLAVFGGEFVLTLPDGKRLFSGKIELLFLVGSHAFEKCDEAAHVEGWLVGQTSKSKNTQLSLRAMIAGKFTCPGPKHDSTDFEGVLCGIVMRPK